MMPTCPRGHLRTPDNDYRGRCRACRREWEARRRGRPIEANPTISSRPIYEYAKEQGLSAYRLGRLMAERYGCRLGTAQKQLERVWSTRGRCAISLYAADRICVAAGVHPRVIYGSGWPGCPDEEAL